jgi:peptide/nickel transport system substrate-binding protein
LLATSACTRQSSSRNDPDTLVEVIRTDGATMNPLFATSVEDGQFYSQLLFESLTYIGADYLPHPRLATSWSHSPDGKTWLVDLRRGVTWSDGQPFTSADVVFTFEALMDPKTAAVNAGDYTYIKRVAADGPYRVRFELAYPSAVFTVIAMGYEASILPAHAFTGIPHERMRTAEFGEHPIGTGPYVLQRWLHDSETVFVRSPTTWRTPHIKRIDVRTIFDEQAVVQSLANGSADLDDDMSSTRYGEYLRTAPQLELRTFPSVYTDVTLPNIRRPGLDDPVVRRAMLYGNDRKSIVAGFFENKVPLPDGLVPAGLAHWHTSDVTQYPYDPAKARAILDAAGWKLGADGVRSRGKTRLSYEVLLNQGSVILTDVMLEFCADMKDIGIDVRLRILDFPSMLSREFAGNFDLVAEGFGGGVDPDLTGNLASASIPPNGFNVGAFNDPKFDKLLKDGLTTLDDAKRQKIYYAMQREIADQVPVLYQYGRFAGLAHSKRLHLDPKTTLQSPLLYYNIEDWTLDP